jgi:ABC-type nickel/cobalt efflux system permease component RcnA
VDVLSVLLTLSFGGCVVCTVAPVFWWIQRNRQNIHQKTEAKARTTHASKDSVKRTDNTSTKRQGQKYRQHIHQKTGSKEHIHINQKTGATIKKKHLWPTITIIESGVRNGEYTPTVDSER